MISYYGHSDVGRQRSRNEDSILTSDRLFLVCDGMGGRKAGEIASRLAIETIDAFHRDAATSPAATDGTELEHHRLKDAIRLANGAIRRFALQSQEHAGMGTTVAALVVDHDGSRAIYASVGDSRIYLIRAGTIAQLSRDDSWVNAAFGSDPADTATKASLQHVLTKALGTHDVLDFEVKNHDLLDGDTLLLCSDGLTTMLTDHEILGIVTRRGTDLEAAGKELIEAANTAGGRDNISAVLVYYSR